MKVEMDYSLQSGKALAVYASWASTYPVAELRKADVKQALAVVTFNQPVPPDELKRLLGHVKPLPVEIVKAVYLDVSDLDPSTNVWTFQTQTEIGRDYVESLDDLVDDVAANGFDRKTGQHFKMQGIVAFTIWLPLDTVDTLNNHELVYLADASPSYLRMVASETKTNQGSFAKNELLRDGFSSHIYTSSTMFIPSSDYS